MLSIGQERSRDNAVLTAEPCCASDFSWPHTLVGDVRKEFQAHTTTAKAVAGALQELQPETPFVAFKRLEQVR